MDVKRPEILLVHARGTWSGLPRLPKLLHGAGARVVIFAPPHSDLWRARYIARRIEAPPTEATFASALRAHLATDAQRYAWILVGDENAFGDLARQSDRAWLHGWFPVAPDSDSLARVTSKAAFVEAALTLGVPMPQSHVCASLEQAHAAAAAIGFPVMLKTACGFGGNGVRMAITSEELHDHFTTLNGRLPLVVQRFEIGRVGSSQVLFDRGRLACWASSYKLATFPQPFGPSSMRELMVHPDMERTLAAVGRMTGFHGISGVDWLHRADGKLLVLEFNPRPAPVVHLGHLSGADFSAAIRDLLAGRQTARPPRDVGPRRVLLFPQHVIRCIEYRQWRDLAAWVWGGSHRDVPWDQPRLLGSHMVKLSGRLFGAARHKAARMWR